VIYADSSVIVRLLEGEPAVRTPIEMRLQPLRALGRFLATSRLSRLECRAQPMRRGDTVLLDLYDAFFLSQEVALLEISPDVLEKATRLRAQLDLNTAAAIHLATGILVGASAFLTGDSTLTRCNEIKVEVV
jgi:predicted nucleic acid-binding protein